MMRSISSYLRPPSWAARWLLAGAVALTATAAGLGWLALQRREASVAVGQRIALLRAATAVKPAPALSKSETDLNKRWGSLKAERDFAWAPLFDALEAAGNPDIELLEFHPDKANSVVMLRGEAKDEAALLDFMDRLSQNPALKHVYLSHRKIRKRERLVTLVFEIKAGIAKPALQ